jgi:TonB family protein
MDSTLSFPHLPPDRAGSSAADEAVSLLVGAVFTLGLFTCMAHFESAGSTDSAPAIEDLRSVAAVVKPPPQKVEIKQQPEEQVMPLTGIDIAASESPVRISVVPPDLEKIIPASDVPPKVAIQFSQLFADLRPKADISGDLNRIFRPSEVDKAPVAVFKTIARVSRRARDDADALRTTLELVIDTEGYVASSRVLKSSGNLEFDTIVEQCVRREWVFSPAIKNGRKVKCLVDQLVWYKWTEGSPFKI